MAEQEELKPKPRRGKVTNPEEPGRAGETAPTLEETMPGPIEEPPLAIDDPSYLATLEAATEIFSDDMSPAERTRMKSEITKLQTAKASVTLIEKIIKVMEAIDAVEKKGRNDAQKYDYQKATDVTKEVRKEFIKQGLILLTDIQDVDIIQIPRDRGSPNTQVLVKGQFTVTDGKESLTFGGAGMGQDVGDKGIYKAFTGMLKYGLRTLLLLPDEKDDPEVARADEVVEGGPIVITPANVKGVIQGGRQTSSTGAQMKAIKDAARVLMLSPEQMAAFVVSETGEGPVLDPGDSDAEQAKQVMAHLEAMPFAELGKVVQGLMEAVEASNGGA